MDIGNYFKSALSGGGSGAAIGSMIPGVGTLAGAGIGAGLGMIGNYFNEQGGDEQKQALDQATAQMNQLAEQNRATQQANMGRALGFFKPAHKAFEYLYGQGSAPMPTAAAPQPSNPFRGAPTPGKV